MTRKLIVHVGLYKTGTTSIQHCLSASTYQLRNFGILYPSSAQHPLAREQHALLARAFDSMPFEGAFALHGQVDRAIVVAAIRHEIDLSGLQTVVISSEELGRYTDESLGSFAEAFRDFEIQPIMFVRNFPDQFESGYSTIIQYTDRTSLPNDHLFDTAIVDRCRGWASVAASGTIHVVDYDALEDGDAVRAFVRWLGIDPDRMDPGALDRRLNRSVSPIQVVAIRELRAKGASPDDIKALVRQLGSLTLNGRYTCLLPDLRSRLADGYAEQMAALRSAPFVTGLEPEGTRPPPSADPIYLGDLGDVELAIGRSLDDLAHG